MSDRLSDGVESVLGIVVVYLRFFNQIRNDSLCLRGGNPMSRSYFSSDRIDRLAVDVSDRELAILTTLERVRLATGAQLETLHFGSDASRQRRRALESLTDRRLVCRLDRTIGGVRAGSSGYLFALDIGGQHVLERLTNRSVRRPSTPGAPFVRHVLGVTDLYVGLVQAERQGLVQIQEFEAEPAAWRRYSGSGGGTAIVKPDAYVRLASDDWLDAFFIEYDRGTESSPTLIRKADVYRGYYASGIEQRQQGVFPKVLWCVPNERRYQTVVDVCSHQPADAWALHQVTLTSDAVGLTTGATL